MPSNPSHWVIKGIAVAGAATAGPVGAIVGRLAGSMLETTLPGMTAFMGSICGTYAGGTYAGGTQAGGTQAAGGGLTGTAAEACSAQALSEKIAARLSIPEKLHVNHDLQAGFIDACCVALYDIGGRACFPEVWAGGPRDVPPGICFPNTLEGLPLWLGGSPLAEQAAAFLQQLEHAMRGQLIIPLDPPSDVPSASAEVYLRARTPAELNKGFYEWMIWPFFAQHRALDAALPALGRHLERYLLDRSLVHLGMILKTRTPAWHAFNRAALEGLHVQVRELAGGQAAVAQRLETLAPAAGSERLADALADLIAAYGQMDKDPGEELERAGQQASAYLREKMERLERLASPAQRPGTAPERRLRFLEDGKWLIEGPEGAAAPGMAAPGIAAPVTAAPGTAVYKGLRWYDEPDAPLFVGRELLTARLANLLEDHPLLAVTGASGSGKSSLVRAGLIPALRAGKLLANGTFPPIGSERWPVVVLTPTARPFEALATCLTRGSESMRQAVLLLDELRADPGSLELFAGRLVGPDEERGKVLLVVDQFEELFTLCHDPAERQAFIDALLVPAAKGAGSALRVVIALRADFYASCAQHPGLREVLSKSQEYIGPMEPYEMRRAIEEPAQRGGWSFEPGVVEQILRDCIADERAAGSYRVEDSRPYKPGLLPMLSQALLETWKHRRGRVMTLESYAESGGVRRAIAHSADAVYQGMLSDAQQAAARRIFLRLTEPGESAAQGAAGQDTRRRARADEFNAGGDGEETIAEVLGVLNEAGLVTVAEDAVEGSGVEMAHEALMREWPTLRRWLEENRAGMRVHRRLSEAAEAWQHGQLEPGRLYRGARLEEAGEWAEANPGELNGLEARFLEASQEQQQNAQNADRRRSLLQARENTRLRRRVLLLAAALVLVALAAVLAAVNAQRADTIARLAAAQQQTAEAARAQAEQSRQETARRAARAEIENGQWLYENGQYSQAIAKYNEALALDSAAHSAGAQSAEAHSAGAQSAEEQSSAADAAYIGRAWAAYQLEDYPAAIADLERVRKKDPALLEANAWNALGWSYFYTEAIDPALESFTRAVELDPSLADGYSGQGWAYYRKADYPAAIARFEKGIKIDPNGVDFYDGLGHTYYRLNDYARAIEYTQKAITLDKEYAYYLNLTFLGWSYFYLDDLDSSLAYFEQARADDPQAFEPYQGIGDVYYARREMGLALDNYHRYLALIRGKGSPEAYVLARVEALEGK